MGGGEVLWEEPWEGATSQVFRQLIPVSVAFSEQEYFYSPLNGMLGLLPALSSPVPIYTPGWREAL